VVNLDEFDRRPAFGIPNKKSSRAPTTTKKNTKKFSIKKLDLPFRERARETRAVYAIIMAANFERALSRQRQAAISQFNNKIGTFEREGAPPIGTHRRWM
jgi:hypothetical protein